METRRRLYLVSFGNSRQYRVEFDDVANVDPFHHTNPIAAVEKEVKDYLEKEFPVENLAYFESPKVEEVPVADAAKYADYPVLDAAAVEEIKQVLKTGVEVMAADRKNDCNARFAEI